MSIFHFESKAAQHKRLMQQFATRLGQEAAKDFRYDPESDPVMKDIFNKLELLRSRKRRCKSKRLTQGVIILPM